MTVSQFHSSTHVSSVREPIDALSTAREAAAILSIATFRRKGTEASL